MSYKPDCYSVILLGTGAFATEAYYIAIDSGVVVKCFVSNDKSETREEICEVRVYNIDSIPMELRMCPAVAVFGHKREVIVEEAKKANISFTTLIHKSIQSLWHGAMGTGILINAGVVIGSSTWIGDHVLLNRGCTIGHHTMIGNYSSVMPGANVAGSVTIGERTYIGMGANIIDHVTIGSDVTVAAGAVVTKDIPDGVMVAGVPAKIKG